MKNILSKMLLLLSLIISVNVTNVFADGAYDYVIKHYDIDIKVNQNNTFDISEVLTVHYNVPKHGLSRSLPLKNTINRLDGTESTNNARVTNISVDAPFTTSKEDGTLYIKIGSIDTTITGSKTYNIKYTYNIGKDPMATYDEFYFNIIGNDWDVPVENTSFNITMPKTFDANKLGFSYGGYGSTASDNIEYSVNGNTISGKLNDILKPYEALTIRLQLPEGYFVNAGFPLDFCGILMCSLPVIFLAISVYFGLRWGSSNEVIETVEFYPPKDANSLDVGFFYKGGASEKHVTSLLIYLANKGYLSIHEVEKKSLLSKHNNFVITKLKDYDGNDKNECLFLEGLFKNKSTVTYQDLFDKFYLTMDKIIANVNQKKNKYRIFEMDSFSKIKYILLMIVALVGIINLPQVVLLGNMTNFGICSVVLGIFVLIMLCALNNINNALFSAVNSFSINTSKKLVSILKGLLITSVSALLLVIHFMLLSGVLDSNYYFYGYIAGLLSMFGMLFILRYFPKRSPFGKEMLGKVRGFKNFLETCEKDKLEAMVMENPTYFYDILPFTYVLDISDTWIKKFEGITMQSPSWYYSSNPFDIMYFNNFMNNTMNSASHAMSSSPSSSSGGSGFSSGGGFSGGGSGGGGGRSW